MASKGKKKAVSQEELRRMMKEKQRTVERQKRVNSPFAKYTSAGKLMCTLCGEHVKSEAVWQAHVLGRGHKDRVGQLKDGQVQSGQTGQSGQVQVPVGSAVKRKKEEEEEEKKKEVVPKKAKSGGLPTDFFQAGASKTSSGAGLGLLAGQYDDDDDDDEKEEEDNNNKVKGEDSKPAGGPPSLPADFFESALPTENPPEPTDEDKEDKKTIADPQLPEGFFDDPVKDAKVRNVDTPRETMDREWEEFQKEMRMVNSASDAIVAEDDEEGRIERQIDEIDEQIECFRRVELLRAKREAAQSRTAKAWTDKSRADKDLEGVDKDEEEDEEELLHVLSRDWRAKGALA